MQGLPEVAGAIVSRVYRVAPPPVRRWWDAYQNDLRISRSPDRAVLRTSIFPAVTDLIAGRDGAEVLWIGCARYTKDYYRVLESRGAQCWTMDIDPKVRCWGRHGRHLTGDLGSAAKLFGNRQFDVVYCNGIFGFGLDSREAQVEAVAAMAAVTSPDGWMLLGWNTNKVPDPMETGMLTPWFEPAELPGFGTRKFVVGCTHVYDFLKRRRDDARPL